MSSTVVGILLTLLLLQFLLALFVEIDAKNLELEHAGGYSYGVLIPIIGYLVFAVYLSERRELQQKDGPRISDRRTARDTDHTHAEQTATDNAGSETESNTDQIHSHLVDSSGVIDRLLAACYIPSFSSWLGGFVYVPALLLLTGLFFIPEVGVFYFAWCPLLLFLYLLSFRYHRETVLSFDPAEKQLEARMSPLLWGNEGYSKEIDLSEIEKVRFQEVRGQLIVTLDPDKPFVTHQFVIPISRMTEIIDLLRRSSVPISADSSTLPSIGRSTRREEIAGLGAVSFVTLVPVVVGLLFPELFVISTAMLLCTGLVLLICLFELFDLEEASTRASVQSRR